MGFIKTRFLAMRKCFFKVYGKEGRTQPRFFKVFLSGTWSSWRGLGRVWKKKGQSMEIAVLLFEPFVYKNL